MTWVIWRQYRVTAAIAGAILAAFGTGCPSRPAGCCSRAGVFGGAVAGLVTWWYAPLNALHQSQFQPGYFDLQGIVPIGYAVFAVALGIYSEGGVLAARSGCGHARRPAQYSPDR